MQQYNSFSLSSFVALTFMISFFGFSVGLPVLGLISSPHFWVHINHNIWVTKVNTFPQFFCINIVKIIYCHFFSKCDIFTLKRGVFMNLFQKRKTKKRMEKLWGFCEYHIMEYEKRCSYTAPSCLPDLKKQIWKMQIMNLIFV